MKINTHINPTEGRWFATPRPKSTLDPRYNPSLGFSLIEMIGVSAVIAILALALAPALIKQLDQIAGDKETARLKAFEAAFRQGVLKTKTIPSEGGWAQMIATNFGIQIAQVTNNDRSVPRLFLIDPEFFQSGGGGGSLPYIQTNSGFTVSGVSTAPFSPRLMILSSISVPLINLSSGPGSLTGPNAFSNIWNTAEGTMPVNWTWTGKPDDLKIQRINLVDSFVRLNPNSDGTSSSGQFVIDGIWTNAIPVGVTYSAFFYYIDSTMMDLYDCTTPTPQYTEILHHSKSFSFSYCNWQAGDQFFTQRVISRPGPFDLQLAADSFLALGSDNPRRTLWNGSPVSRQNVLDSMIEYMTNYIIWASNSFAGNVPGNGQSDLKATTTAIISP